jgi:hypothetical protein
MPPASIKTVRPMICLTGKKAAGRTLAPLRDSKPDVRKTIIIWFLLGAAIQLPHQWEFLWLGGDATALAIATVTIGGLVVAVVGLVLTYLGRLLFRRAA